MKVIIRIKIFNSAHFSFSGISIFARYVMQNDREYRAAVNHYLKLMADENNRAPASSPLLIENS